MNFLRAIYLSGGSGLITHCGFTNNYIHTTPRSGYGTLLDAYGGAICADGADPITVRSCNFSGGYMLAGDTTSYDRHGGCLYLKDAVTMDVSDCVIEDNTDPSANAQASVWIDSSATAHVRDLVVNNVDGNAIHFAGSGSLTLTNCLAVVATSHGVEVAGGTVTLQNCTLADNTAWGLTNASGTVTLQDCIVWGNTAGSILGSATVDYSDIQGGHGGTGNLDADPQFVAGYYLDSASTPCDDVGSAASSVYGMDQKTTRLDLVNDTGVVDMGYHYEGGGAPVVPLTDLYVKTDGDDLLAGTNWVLALKTVTKALELAENNVTIHVATGTYDVALGEVFPLSVQNFGVSILGTNRDETVIRGDQNSRILTVANKTGIILEGLTIENGKVSNDHGGGVFFQDGDLTVSNCIIRGNWAANSSAATVYGAGLYSSGADVTILDSVISNNLISVTKYDGADNSGAGLYGGNGTIQVSGTTFAGNRFEVDIPRDTSIRGGAAALVGVEVTFSNCTFNGNYGDNAVRGDTKPNYSYGGAVYLSGGTGLVVDCAFQDNYLTAKPWDAETERHNAYGGAIYAVNIQATTFSGGYLDLDAAGDKQGSVLCLAGSSALVMSDCEIADNDELASIAKAVLWLGSSGTVSLTNVLVVSSIGSGVAAADGTISLQNCTIADNTGWGLTNASGTVTLQDCIVWGNTSGGIDGSATVDYSDIQGGHAGTFNLDADPQFVAGYYLDSASTPCDDVGSAAASAYGMDQKTTRTDLVDDSGVVDMGYHYDGGGTPPEVLTDLYVKTDGDDLLAGTNWVLALKTVTKALDLAQNNVTIHVATGTYDVALGEVFPLSVQDLGVLILGTNRNATLIRGDQNSRVLEIANKTGITLSGLTVENGKVSNTHGGGLYVTGGDLTVTNCIIRGNQAANSSAATVYGGGLYGSGTDLTILDSVFSNNLISVTKYDGADNSGGGLYGANSTIQVSATAFAGNRISVGQSRDTSIRGGAVALTEVEGTFSNCTFNGNYGDNAVRGGTKISYSYGGAIYLSGGTGVVVDCAFQDSYLTATLWPPADETHDAYGGAIYAVNVNALTIQATTFSGGYLETGAAYDKQGSVLCLAGSSSVVLSGCDIRDNDEAGSLAEAV
ncbi:right-handed parallel beta-helix repeat-containing protein, partial [Verrucomicrobiota bacterium]